ncbi:hypothetical protein BWI75_24785, partial [Gloeocapsopsis sp. AAB1 = 1H9]|nr:hypothetical protein [Gloeocapsopsis dulcis AAB1 = 1H9]
NDPNDGVVCQSTGAAHASQTAAFTVGLQNLTDLLWANVTMIVEGIEAFVEGLMAARAKIPLDSTRCLAVLVSFQVSTQWAFHRFNNVVMALLLYSTHLNLMHDRLFVLKQFLQHNQLLRISHEKKSLSLASSTISIRRSSKLSLSFEMPSSYRFSQLSRAQSSQACQCQFDSAESSKVGCSVRTLHLSTELFVFSMTSYKQCSLNKYFPEWFISKLGLKPTLIENHPNYKELRFNGVITVCFCLEYWLERKG